ncbi:hypothetical protein [Calidithermus chliarophilus]|uniref:hypothetical protein n=1 Tax=Calidithermus chliarophilus TaxID=52023 RepID=UPI00041B527B|nr:hypothetical protein [Calidithermus chliarophilus]
MFDAHAQWHLAQTRHKQRLDEAERHRLLAQAGLREPRPQSWAWRSLVNLLGDRLIALGHGLKGEPWQVWGPR